jgi:hypothetical protein
MNFIKHFSEYLAERYSSEPDGESAVMIKFEAVGVPISSNDVTDYSISKLANEFPRADTDVYVAASLKLDSLFDQMLNSARLPAGEDKTAFNKMKSRALGKLEASERAPPSSVAVLYHLSHVSPRDWYTNDEYWTKYSGDPSGDKPKPSQPMGGFDEHAAFHNDVVIKAAGDTASLSRASLIPTIVDDTLKPQNGRGSVEDGQTLDVDARVNALRGLNFSATASTTEAHQLSLEYCIVNFERKWLDQSLFTLFRDWFMPNTHKGQISKSPVGFKHLPVAMVVVRGLSINAKWSEEDAAQIPTAASLGPFSLAGGTWEPESGALQNENTQIIGWLCTPIPTMPPKTDPSLLLHGTEFVKIEHAGWYVAKFEISWDEKNNIGDYIRKSWSSGEKSTGFSQQIDMPDDAINLRVEGWAKTGLVWDPWGQIMSISAAEPTNKLYKVTGTTLNRDCEINEP